MLLLDVWVLIVPLLFTLLVVVCLEVLDDLVCVVCVALLREVVVLPDAAVLLLEVVLPEEVLVRDDELDVSAFLTSEFLLVEVEVDADDVEVFFEPDDVSLREVDCDEELLLPVALLREVVCDEPVLVAVLLREEVEADVDVSAFLTSPVL